MLYFIFSFTEDQTKQLPELNNIVSNEYVKIDAQTNKKS
jgi:hypothetical protein